jgi:hypothetical protein
MPAASQQPRLQLRACRLQQLPRAGGFWLLSADLPDIIARLHTLFFLRDCWRSVPGGIPLASCRQHARCNKGHLIYTPFGAEKGGSFFAWLNINTFKESGCTGNSSRSP